MTIISDLVNVYERLDQLMYDVKKIHDKLLKENVSVTSVLILDLVTSNPGSTANELAEMVGAEREKVRKLLYGLMKQKKVVNSGHKICDVTNNETYCWYPK